MLPNALRFRRVFGTLRRGVEQRQLVGLITQRSQVRVLPPQPVQTSRRPLDLIIQGLFVLTREVEQRYAAADRAHCPMVAPTRRGRRNHEYLAKALWIKHLEGLFF